MDDNTKFDSLGSDENANPIDTNDKAVWVDFVKRHKEVCIKGSERGDITPTLIVERDNHILTIISAPQVDRDMGLIAAHMAKVGFDPDVMTILFDAHMKRYIKPEDKTPEEFANEVQENYEQRMRDDEGACEKGLITDCITCHRIDRNGKMKILSLPYSYHGKQGPALKWLDEEPEYKDHLWLDDADSQLQGLIPHALRKIMGQKTVTEEFPKIKEFAEHFDFTPERARFHTSRALMGILSQKSYLVADFLTPMHLEWIDYKPKAKAVLEIMKEKGCFPEEAMASLLAVVESDLGTPTFKEKFTALVKANSYWFPAEIRNDEAGFADFLESTAFSPEVPQMDEPVSGSRVKVWNGDRSEYLGEGTYTGDVAVYFIRKSDKEILSLQNAEVEPTPDQIPEGATVIRQDGNPKIVLDSGRTVYGCQVWWEAVKEDKKQFNASAYNKAK